MLNILRKTYLSKIKSISASALILLFISIVIMPRVMLAQSQKNLTIAVASNYYPQMQKIAQEYQAQNNIKITLVSGSTGKLYLQILNHAPYDLFFAADSKHPEKLITQNKALKNSLVTYAKARLVLITASKNTDLSKLGERALSSLNNSSSYWLAMANPKLAPCGEAAEQVIRSLKLNQKLEGKIVRAENVSQVLGQVMSHAAQYGFVTYAQVQDKLDSAQIWMIPENYYQPILEQAVVLKNSKNKKQAQEFLDFVMRQQSGNIK